MTTSSSAARRGSRRPAESLVLFSILNELHPDQAVDDDLIAAAGV